MNRTVLTDLATIKHLVDAGHTVYAGSDSYRVIKDSIGEYLIEYANGADYVGLHGMAGTKYENKFNASPIYIKRG